MLSLIPSIPGVLLFLVFLRAVLNSLILISPPISVQQIFVTCKAICGDISTCLFLSFFKQVTIELS